jgi:Fic family protein
MYNIGIYPIPIWMIHMLEPRLLDRLQQKKAQLDALRPLLATALHRRNRQLTVEWIYNSNAIEGSTLTLRETQLILETGLTIGGKSLREHLEVINHQEAIKYVETLTTRDEPITALHVRQIHRLVLARIDDDSAGQYRTLPVRIAGSTHQPPEAWEVSPLLTNWETWLKDPRLTLHPIERAALAHHRLVAIHPFLDGNGRAARLVMNLLLMREGYPPTIIMRVNRRQYYNVLARADAGHETPLVNFVGRAVERSLTLYLEACTPSTAPPSPEDEWIPLREAAKGTPYSQEYLSLLARTGRLEAIKQGRVWHTSRRAMEAYRQSLK